MTELHYQLHGKGPALVLLHGWGFDGGVWHSLLDTLSQRYTVYSVDLPGFGKSPLPETYSLKAVSEMLLAIIPAKASVMGWSLGGVFAYYLAIHHPERITKLITVASSARFVNDNEWPGLQATVLSRFKNNLLHNYVKTMKEFLVLQCRGSSMTVADLKHLKQLIMNNIPSEEALLGAVDLLVTTDLRHELTKITCPNLHIFGGRDALVPVAVNQHIQAYLPNACVATMDKAAHIPFLSHPNEFMRILEEIL